MSQAIKMNFYISTLKRTPARAVAGATALYISGVPYESIILHCGKDGNDFESPQQMYDAFIKAYPQMEGLSYQTNSDDETYMMARGNQGCLWSTLEILDRFLESDATVGYYNQDDRCGFRFLTDVSYYRDIRPANDLFFQVERLLQIDPKLKVFQLGYERKIRTEYNEPIEPDLPICRGIRGKGDSGIVFTKSGALWISQLIFHYKNSLEVILFNHVGQDEPHIYATLTPERFHWDIEKSIIYPEVIYPNKVREEERKRLNREDTEKHGIPSR